MNFSVQSIITSFQRIWQKLNKRQRIITITLPLAVLTLLLILVWWAGRPDYTPLFQGPLSADDAGAVVNKLKDLKVPYQLNDDGTTVLVPKKQLADVRLQLATAGIPQNSKFSFDYLNNTMQFGETDADRKVRYTLALQSELETTLKTLAAVQDARVHLVIPEQSLFTDQQKDPTAAVTLKLQPGSKLSDEQLRGIANLLASSVEGLKIENVSIIDTNGELLSENLNNKDTTRLSDNQLQMQQTIERNLEHAAQTMLDHAFGPGKSIVRVASTLNFDKVEVKKESYGNNVLRSRQDHLQTVTGGGGASGVPGTNSNVPGYQTINGNSAPTQEITSDSTVNYEVDKTEEDRQTNPGNIQQLSVSVLLDAQKANPQTIQAVKDMVTTAVGLNTQRGDQIQVVAMPFNNQYLDNERQAMLDNSQRQRYLEYMFVGLGLFAALVLAAIWLIRKRKAAEEQKLLNDVLSTPVQGLVQFNEAAAAMVTQKEDKFLATLRKAAQAKPEEVAKVIKLWLREE